MELVHCGIEECRADSFSSVTGCYEEAHNGAHSLVGVCHCYCVMAHVGKVGPRLGVAPAHRITINVSKKALSFAGADLFGSGGSMLGSGFRCRVPVVSGGIVKAAVASGPVGKVGKGLIEESQIVLQQLRF